MKKTMPQFRAHVQSFYTSRAWCACYIRPHICHREIHATLSESELARSYATMDALRAHPRLAKFIAWVARRPPEFASRVPGRRRKGRR